jgi:hypothetical protein
MSLEKETVSEQSHGAEDGEDFGVLLRSYDTEEQRGETASLAVSTGQERLEEVSAERLEEVSAEEEATGQNTRGKSKAGTGGGASKKGCFCLPFMFALLYLSLSFCYSCGVGADGRRQGMISLGGVSLFACQQAPILEFAP